MADNTLIAEARPDAGKGIARRLRATGRIPAVLYGRGLEAQSLSVETRALEHVLHTGGAGRNTLIDLQVGGKGSLVMVKDLHREPVRGAFMHCDFYAIDRDQRVDVRVPIHFEGKAPGVDMGGIVDHPVRELELNCLVTAIPEFIEADISTLEIGDSIHVSDLTVPSGAEVVTDAEAAVAICMAPRAVEEETEAEGVVEEGAEDAAAGEGDAKTEDGDS